MELRNITVMRGDQIILNDVSLTVPLHKIIALIGESGAGKTTLLRVLAGLERGNAGSRIIDEADKVGMVFQQLHLFPHMTALEQVAHPLYTVHNVARDHADTRARKALAAVGLASYGMRYPHELSGGQQQRVALARAIVQRPTILLLDEPTSGLDAATRDSLIELLQQLRDLYKATIIMTTHDTICVEKIADHIWHMAHGKYTIQK